MRNLILALAAAVMLAAPASLQAAPAAREQDAQQRAVERLLLPAVVFDGEAKAWTLAERMDRWKVPGISIAVVDGGRIAWARGYGVQRAGSPEPVTADTRFQAASISKPVAAMAALRLVQDRRLSLDADVNTVLKRWRLPAGPFTADRPLTLRDLLSHTGGTTVHGFPGYARGAAVPTLVQVLNGEAPANTAAVVSERRPGEAWKYSGGGYEIVQLMIEDLTNQSFADIVRQTVLGPIGMPHSGYALPPAGRFAHGHGIDGKEIPGGWHTYPEQAAAGLWTTPTDLSRFGLALWWSWRKEPGALLKPETVQAMTTPVMGGYGLGPGVGGEGRALAFSHGGSNEGFRCFWVIHPVTGDGAVVMTNGEAGDRLMMEVSRAVARAYGWIDFAPRRMNSFTLPAETLEAREGVWSAVYDGDRIAFTVRRDGRDLAIETFRGTYAFTPTSATEMVAADTGSTARFETGSDGKPVLRVFGLELKQEG